jgi:Holliday junction resolvase RusA-like endonuclease
VSALWIKVFGEPAPQGSKRHVGGGRMVEASKKVAPWREHVHFAAVEAIAEHEVRAGTYVPWVPMSGGLSLTVAFFLPRPKSAPKSRTRPDRTPDLDKLLRSTCDALTSAGVWEDDARVVDILASKHYAGPLADLHSPGAIIRVEF